MKSIRILVAVILSALAAGGAWAQLPGAKLSFMFPPGGQVGTSLEVALVGSGFNGVERLEFSHPGITGAPIMSGGDEFIKRQQWQRNRFTVTIASDVPPGVYQGWFVGSYGISNATPFVVGDMPQAAEVSGNNSRETAHAVALNSAVVGRTDANKADCFKIQLKAGQQVVIDCEAGRIGSRLDAVLAVFDSAGKPLARSRSDRGHDPVVLFKAPADGDYVIELSDFLSAGGADRLFRLVVSDRPQITAIFPPAAVPGTKNKHTIYGANLPGGADKVDVEIDQPQPGAVLGAGYAVRPRELLSTGSNYRLANSNSVRIPFATAPVVIEDAAAEIQKIALPAEIAGHLLPIGDADVFEFEAKKGEVLFIEGISHRAGHATDLQFTVSKVTIDAEGKRSENKVGEADDDANAAGGKRAAVNSRDPLLKFTAPEDASYVVRLIDQFQLDDAQASYRLAIRRPVADFVLLAELEDPIVNAKRLDNWSAALLRGGRVTVGVRALRRDGFDGEIQLGLEGAPAGVEVVAGKIEKGKASGKIVLIGGGELKNWSGALRVTGKSAKPEGGELLRTAFGVSMVREVADYDQEQVISRLDESLVMASRETLAPFAIVVDGPQVIETSMGGTVELPIKITKLGAFKGAMKFYASDIPNVKKRPEISLDLNKVAEGKLKIEIKPNNENKYAPGSYQVPVRGDGVLQYKPDPLSVVQATEDQKAVEPMLVAANEALKAAQAKKGEIGKSALTDEEKAKQIAAADEVIAKAQAHVKAAEAAKKRAAELLKQANDRNKPRDLKVVGYSKPITLNIAGAPLRFKDVAAEMQVAKGASGELAVGFERLFGFAEAVELSLVAPKNLKGIELKPVPVAKDQAMGKLTLKVNPDAPEGEHAFTLNGKVTFNGVACVLSQPLKVKVVAAAPVAPAPAPAPAAPAPAAPAPNP